MSVVTIASVEFSNCVAPHTVSFGLVVEKPRSENRYTDVVEDNIAPGDPNPACRTLNTLTSSALLARLSQQDSQLVLPCTTCSSILGNKAPPAQNHLITREKKLTMAKRMQMKRVC